MKFHFYQQYDMMDCGPTCLRMIARYHGKSLSQQFLYDKCQTDRSGVSLLSISEAAEGIGFKTVAARLTYSILQKDGEFPCIAHWNRNHFVVIRKMTNSMVWIADPAHGLAKLTKSEFEKRWISSHQQSEGCGVVLLLSPNESFFEDESHSQLNTLNFGYLVRHIAKHKRLFFHLIIGLFIGIILQVMLPFLTQAVIDTGIPTKDMGFITLVLFGQLMIFIGSTTIDFIRNWILLHISTRINLSLLTDFLIKLMRLPMSFFDAKLTGDILQRMGDHSRIQSFLTTTLLTTAVSLINFFVFTVLSIAYGLKLFAAFALGSTMYIGWIMLFLKARKKLDVKQFNLSSSSQSFTIEMIQGMQEIKLHNCERQKRWIWESLQAKLFKANLRGLFLSQVQGGGALFINQAKNVVITFLTAKQVVQGELTFGEMMAVQYIIGQLNNPIQQIVSFIQSYQDTKISIGRVNEIQGMSDEESTDYNACRSLPVQKNIEIFNLSFKYSRHDNNYVLSNISLEIPEGKTTAIVGMSGSGKTTLLKLLLRFYNIDEGEIKIGGTRFNSLSPGYWRSKCGVVMQDSFLFSDSIASNVAVGDELPDIERLLYALRAANIHEYVDSLPQGLNTRIGANGVGLSQGQRQRILIARAIYKNPDYLFLDEATNSLDANNEKTVMENINEFIKGRTVVVVAHRLSTVKNADQIIVLNKGRIIERGNHEELTAKRSQYYELVENQLERRKSN